MVRKGELTSYVRISEGTGLVTRIILCVMYPYVLGTFVLYIEYVCIRVLYPYCTVHTISYTEYSVCTEYNTWWYGYTDTHTLVTADRSKGAPSRPSG